MRMFWHLTLTKWKTGVALPEIGGTTHTQSAGHPPRARSCKQRFNIHQLNISEEQYVSKNPTTALNRRRHTSLATCFIKDSVVLWWSAIVTFASCNKKGRKTSFVSKNSQKKHLDLTSYYSFKTHHGFCKENLSVRPSVCPSVRPSVCPSVRLSVRLSVRPSVHWYIHLSFIHVFPSHYYWYSHYLKTVQDGQIEFHHCFVFP